MKGRFSILISVLCVAACSSGGGVKRMPVTPQVLDCGPAGLASVRLVSPTDAEMSFGGKRYNLKRESGAKRAYYKGGGVEFESQGAFGVIRMGGKMHHCDMRPRDLEPEPIPTIVPEVEQRVPRLDVTPYL